MRMAKRKTGPDMNEVLEVKKREIAEAKGKEEPVDPMIQAKRVDAYNEQVLKERDKILADRREGREAPVMEDIIEDDMRSEADIQREKDTEILRELTMILKVPKTRDSVPTFSMYTSGMLRRYFFLDVDGTAYRKGWAYYKSQKGDDPVGYIDMVIHILDLEIPRLHRAVDWAPLN